MLVNVYLYYHIHHEHTLLGTNTEITNDKDASTSRVQSGFKCTRDNEGSGDSLETQVNKESLMT